MVDYRSKVSIGVISFIGLAILAAALYVFVLKPANPAKTTSGSDPAVYELVWNGQNFEHLEIKDFKAYMTKTGQPILADFWAEWCGPCRQSAPTIEALAKTYAGKVHVVKINTDFAGSIANDFAVTEIPHFVVIKGGKEVDSVTGYSDELKAILSGKLDAALG